jgi:hypothetical protein
MIDVLYDLEYYEECYKLMERKKAEKLEDTIHG